MTFAARTLQGVSSLPGVITSPFVNIRNTSTSTGIRSGGFTLVNDGSITKSNATGSTAWFSPILAGIGSQIWANFTTTTSTNSTVSGSIGTWVPLSAGASWSVSNTSTGNEGTGTFSISFASDSAGSNVVGSGSGSWDVGFAP